MKLHSEGLHIKWGAEQNQSKRNTRHRDELLPFLGSWALDAATLDTLAQVQTLSSSSEDDNLNKHLNDEIMLYGAYACHCCSTFTY